MPDGEAKMNMMYLINLYSLIEIKVFISLEVEKETQELDQSSLKNLISNLLLLEFRAIFLNFIMSE